MKFRVRVDDKLDFSRPKGEEVGSQWLHDYLVGKAHVLVHHVLPHGNPHHHFYIDLPLVNSVASYVYHWKKLISDKGLTKSDWSIKQCTDDRKPEYISYLFNTKHGNVATLISHTEPVEEARANAASISLAFEERKETRDKKAPTKQVTSWDMAEELRTWIDANIEDHEYQLGVIRECIAIHRRHRKTFCAFSLERVIHTALGGSKKADWIVSQVADKLYKYSQ